jgi:hypothetical protein
MVASAESRQAISLEMALETRLALLSAEADDDLSVMCS